jgi:hypothetical protein
MKINELIGRLDSKNSFQDKNRVSIKKHSWSYLRPPQQDPQRVHDNAAAATLRMATVSQINRSDSLRKGKQRIPNRYGWGCEKRQPGIANPAVAQVHAI